MTVAELMEHLRAIDPEAKVYAIAYDEPGAKYPVGVVTVRANGDVLLGDCN